MSANTRQLKRYYGSQSVGTSEADISGIAVPSGKTWEVLRCMWERTAVAGSPTNTLKWTNSSNTKLMTLYNVAADAGTDTVAQEIQPMRGAVMYAGDKFRAVRSGGTSWSIRVVLYVMEE